MLLQRIGGRHTFVPRERFAAGIHFESRGWLFIRFGAHDHGGGRLLLLLWHRFMSRKLRGIDCIVVEWNVNINVAQ